MFRGLFSFLVDAEMECFLQHSGLVFANIVPEYHLCVRSYGIYPLLALDCVDIFCPAVNFVLHTNAGSYTNFDIGFRIQAVVNFALQEYANLLHM